MVARDSLAEIGEEGNDPRNVVALFVDLLGTPPPDIVDVLAGKSRSLEHLVY